MDSTTEDAPSASTSSTSSSCFDSPQVESGPLEPTVTTREPPVQRPQHSHQPTESVLAEGSDRSSKGGATLPEEKEEENSKSVDKGKGKAKAEDRFNCCICLDLAEDPVVTPCGHLSCWSCCHEWLVTSNKRTCPTCKAPVTVDKLIPIYSSSGEEQKDPRKVPLPPRPRPAAPPSGSSTSFFGIPFPASTLSSSLSSSSFSFQAGGLFPFSGVSMSYTYPPIRPEEAGPASGFDMRRGLVPGGEQEWLRQTFQQIFLVLFFAVFVMITFSG